MTRREYLVLYETAEDGSVSAHVPDLPIILAAGSNQDEARQSVREAIEVYLEELNEAGQPIPEPSVAYEFVGISA
jgi:predicted RNase H-like HicB family nuclease